MSSKEHYGVAVLEALQRIHDSGEQPESCHVDEIRAIIEPMIIDKCRSAVYEVSLLSCPEYDPHGILDIVDRNNIDDKFDELQKKLKDDYLG